jgi:hypothetical protein
MTEEESWDNEITSTAVAQPNKTTTTYDENNNSEGFGFGSKNVIIFFSFITFRGIYFILFI